MVKYLTTHKVQRIIVDFIIMSRYATKVTFNS